MRTTTVQSARIVMFLGCAVIAGPLPAQAAWAFDEVVTSRLAPAAVYDAARGVTVLFGGNDGTRRNDTWLWDGTVLTRAATPVAPPPMQDHAMVFDSVRARVVLVGNNETWSWNGATWSSLGAAPTMQGSIGLAYDAGRDRVVLAGGNGGGFLQLWEFNGASWTQMPLNVSNWPGPDAPIPFTFDATAGNCAMFTVNPPRMWRWNGTVWTWQAAATPAMQSGARMLHDPVQQRLLLVGGHPITTGPVTVRRWVAASGTWQSLATDGPVLNQLAVAFDSARNRVIQVGGHLPGGTIDSSLWEWNAAGWQRRTHASPTGREAPGLAADRATGRVLLFGGSSKSDTWQFFQDRWTLLLPQPSSSGTTHPAPADQPRLVFDEARGEFLLWHSNSASISYFWRWTGSQWSPIPMSGAVPSHRSEPSICYDRLRQRVLLFGGNSGSQRLQDLWQWDGSAWTQLVTPLVPEPRQGAGMAYDPIRDRVVLLGGMVIGGSPLDTWEYDGTAWLLVPGTSNQSTTIVQVAWDEARQAVIATFSTTGATPGIRTWQWNGSSWDPIANTTTPLRWRATLASTADAVFQLGGISGTTLVAEPARLTTPHPAHLAPFGTSGFSSAGPLVLAGVGPRPWLGDALTLRMSPLPSIALAGGWLGASNTSWNGSALPLDLGTIGYPGNAILCAPDVPLPVLNLGNGTAELTIAIPNTPTLASVDAFVQTFVFEPLSGAVATSNGITLHLGLR